MKKTIAICAAIGLTSAAYADNHMQDDGTAEQDMPTTQETQVYDGPDSSTPGQPAPAGNWRSILRSQSMASFTANARTDYPTCTREVRDNCKQARDPGY